jgi:hypothetical protein
MSLHRPDLYTKIVLTVIAIWLGFLALRPAVNPAPVQAQSGNSSLYIEPGTVTLRKPDGSSMGEGKLVVDLKTGEIWGFPTYMTGAPYPIDVTSQKPATSKPVYLGRYDFDAMKQAQ